MRYSGQRAASLEQHVWDGSPAAGKSLLSEAGCGDTPRWVVRVTAPSGVSNEDNPECPRGARMTLKDYSD